MPNWPISCSIRLTGLATILMPMLRLPGIPNLHAGRMRFSGTASGKPADQIFAELREKYA